MVQSFLTKVLKRNPMLKALMEKENNVINKYFVVGLTILVIIVITVNVVMYFI